LREQKIDFRVVNNDLKLFIPTGYKDTGIIEILKKNKRELIDYINKRIALNVKSRILPASFKDYYKLSSAQKRMYFLHELDKFSLAYNMSQFFSLQGEVDTDRLGKICKELINRHEGLRTSFELIDGNPLQKISAQVNFEIEIYYGNEHIEAISKKFIRPFDLRKAPLMRVGLIRNVAKAHILMTDIHHIICDGESEGLLIKDLMALYNNERLPDLPLQYKDYAEWQQSDEQQDMMQYQKDFWKKDLSGELPLLELPYDFPRPLIKSYDGDYVDFEISAADTSMLKKLAEVENSTMYMLLLTVNAVLLSKLANTDDVIVGTPVASRLDSDLENVVGMFVNTLPIRCYPKGAMPFNVFLSEIRSKLISCLDNQAFSYEQLIEELMVDRNTGRNPLFDVMFAYQNFEALSLEIPGLVLTTCNIEHTISQFDLSLWAFETDGKILLKFEYSTKLFSKDTINRFIACFKKIISTIIIYPDKRISDISIVGDDEQIKLLKTFNSTKTDYPRDETVISLFEQQVRKTPAHTAVICGGTTLCYLELHRLSNKVAMYLRDKMNVKQGDLVGLIIERELYLIPCIFGILKAGATYVPISPQYPEERIKSIVIDSELKVLLSTNKQHTAYLANLPGYVDLDVSWNDIIAQPEITIETLAKGDTLAYIIFTSGSTGRPKGVMIEHHAVVNRILWMQLTYPITETDVILQKTSIVFDVSVWELFWWSFTGAALCLLRPGGEQEPNEIIKVISEYKVTTIHFVPSMLSSFLTAAEGHIHYLSSLKYVFSSGEELKPEQVKLFGKLIGKINGTRLVNLYGPTEATVDVSYYECDFSKNHSIVPIGKPINNISLYVLNTYKELVPIGVAGELYIAGVGLARGYLNNKELTDKKFVNNPNVHGERMYATGDIAVWLPDGNIRYLGRIDNQVKIRGYRIELGEIENQLLLHEVISEATVMLKGKDGNKYLVAYYVPKREIYEKELKTFLSFALPSYMIPAHFVSMMKLPTTSNGKLDKRALPDPVFPIDNCYSAPSSVIECKLAFMWATVLACRMEEVGIRKSFFELGGHSMKAFHLINSINKEFSVNMGVRDIFENPTIESQASLLESMSSGNIVPILKVAENEFYGVSAAQERLFYQQMLYKDSIAYNNNLVLRIKTEVDISKLNRSLQQLIDRHSVLRTKFLLTIDGVMQKLVENVEFHIEELNTLQLKNIEDSVKYFTRPFNPESDFLMRCGLITFPQEGSYLLVDIHHIICDGISLNILIRDLAAIYMGEKLELLPLSYLDYAGWQRSYDMRKQQAYWMRKLSGELPTLDLPVKQNKGGVDIHSAFLKTMKINATQYQEIRTIASDADASPFMFLLSLFYILLSKMSGKTDIIIGTDVVGRTHEAFKNVVGTFVNILPLRITVDNEVSYREFLAQVKQCVLEGLDNQEYQFEQMVVLQRKEKKNNFNDIVRVHFSFDDVIEGSDALNQLSFVPVEVFLPLTTKYELQFTAKEENGTLYITFVASTGLYEEETISLMLDYHKHILETILENAEIRIGSILFQYK
jgi:amino acid adenylation domain-containing protein